MAQGQRGTSSPKPHCPTLWQIQPLLPEPAPGRGCCSKTLGTPRQSKHKAQPGTGTGWTLGHSVSPAHGQRAQTPKSAVAAPELPSLSTKGFQGRIKQLCLTQQNTEGEAFRQNQGKHGAEKCSEWLQSTAECCVQGTQAASVPGTSQKGKPRAQSWHRQQVCTASSALPDHRDFYGNRKGNRGRFFRRKACPSRAKLTGAQPEASAQPVSALLPLFLPQQLPVVARKNFAPFSCGCLQGFVTLCSAGGFTHSCVTNPGSNPNPYIHIYT